jgi:hypothetical protein
MAVAQADVIKLQHRVCIVRKRACGRPDQLQCPKTTRASHSYCFCRIHLRG